MEQQVSGASLGVFRIAFGVIMILEAITLVRPAESAGGKVPLDVYYSGAGANFNLPYSWFEWLPLLPKPLMLAAVFVQGFVVEGARIAATELAQDMGVDYTNDTVALAEAYLAKFG